MKVEDRKHSRFETTIPIQFNLNPEYHFVFEIKRTGVGGFVRNISFEGLGIDSRMDLLDICQIFSEAIEDGSTLELEVVLTDPKGRKEVIKGSVVWYQLGEPEKGIREFRAGLHLKNADSRSVARGIVESITPTPMS